MLCADQQQGSALSHVWGRERLAKENKQGGKDLHHEEQEADKDVGIEAVLGDELFRIGSYDVGYPPQEAVRECVDSFPVCSEREPQ